jgi:putative endonuclease
LYFVYVLHSEKSHCYYIGSSKDIKPRLAQHNSGMMRFSRPYKPWQVVYTEAYETLAEGPEAGVTDQVLEESEIYGENSWTAISGEVEFS